MHITHVKIFDKLNSIWLIHIIIKLHHDCSASSLSASQKRNKPNMKDLSSTGNETRTNFCDCSVFILPANSTQRMMVFNVFKSVLGLPLHFSPFQSNRFPGMYQLQNWVMSLTQTNSILCYRPIHLILVVGDTEAGRASNIFKTVESSGNTIYQRSDIK